MKYLKIFEDFSQKDILKSTGNKPINIKQSENGFGKVSKGTITSNTYRLGDKVEVYMTSEKHAGKVGTIVVPTDLHKMKDKSNEMIKVLFEDGSEDYVSKYFLNKI